MSSSRLDRSRRPLIIGCLAAALLLVVALGYEAIHAARAQRDAVEGVLRDYAALAAEQYGRNIGVTLDYEWALPALRLIGAGELDFEAIEPLDANAEVAGQRGDHRLGDVAAGFFVLEDPATARYLSVSGAEEPDLDALTRTVVRHNDSRYEADWPYAALLRPKGGENLLIAYRRVGDTPYPVVGVVSAPGTLRDLLARAVTVYDLLPPTLTEGTGDAPLVHVRALAGSGETLFAHGPTGGPALSGRFDLHPRMAGLRVIATIPAASAERLVVGGLPYSRLPLIAGMLLLAIALLASGGLLWRREQELIALREQFVAGASHELRTPLAQIRMFAETLRLERVRSDDERNRALEVIDREARRLSLLVENLLQFSNPARRSQRFVPEEIDLLDLAREVINGFEPLAGAAGATIELAAPPAELRISGDRDMLRQMLVNLLDNAVKYGPEGQTVRVQLRQDGSEASIAVVDQGPGIPPSERTLVWQRFWRGPCTDGVTGTGIGLALVRELVDLHGGSVAVDDDPGGGACFVVRLPTAHA